MENTREVFSSPRKRYLSPKKNGDMLDSESLADNLYPLGLMFSNPPGGWRLPTKLDQPCSDIFALNGCVLRSHSILSKLGG